MTTAMAMDGDLVDAAIDAVVQFMRSHREREQDRSLDDLVHGTRGGATVEAEERACNAMQALQVLVGKPLVDKAVAVCEKRKAVTKYVAMDSRRECYKVRGEQDDYLCFRDLSYCSCHNFAQRCVSSFPLCKHVIAMKLAEGLGIIEQVQVPDSEFAKYLFS